MLTRSGRKASQQPNELARFIDILSESEVSRYLEIGTRHGDTFFEVVKSLPKGSKAVAVDLPGGKWGKDSSRQAMIDCADELIAMGYEITLIFGDSTKPSLIAEIAKHGPYDAVFIDGDHSYNGVKQDWLNYGTAPIVAFHDIDGEGVYSGNLAVEVPKLWAEIKGDFKHESIIDCADGRRMGIGVIWR